MSIPLGLLNGIGVVGIVVLVGLAFLRALANGTLCTGRELREKNARIEVLEETVKTLTEQNGVLINQLPVVGNFLRALRDAGGLGDDR